MWMETVARREPSRDAETAAGPEDGAGFACATGGGNAGKGGPKARLEHGRENPGNGRKKKIHFLS